MPLNLNELREAVRSELRKVTSPEQLTAMDRTLLQVEDKLLLLAWEQLNKLPFVGPFVTAALAKSYAAGLAAGFKQGEACGYTRAKGARPQLHGRRS